MSKRNPIAAACVVACASLWGCTLFEAPQGRGPLPPMDPDRVPPSPYQPDQPYTVEDGVGVRDTFPGAAAMPGVKVAVRDLIVAPAEKPAAVSLPGEALVEVRSGAGTALVGGKEVELKAGQYLSVPVGGVLHVRASGEPVALRAHLFIAE